MPHLSVCTLPYGREEYFPQSDFFVSSTISIEAIISRHANVIRRLLKGKTAHLQNNRRLCLNVVQAVLCHGSTRPSGRQIGQVHLEMDVVGPKHFFLSMISFGSVKWCYRIAQYKGTDDGLRRRPRTHFLPDLTDCEMIVFFRRYVYGL